MNKQISIKQTPEKLRDSASGNSVVQMLLMPTAMSQGRDTHQNGQVYS